MKPLKGILLGIFLSIAAIFSLVTVATSLQHYFSYDKVLVSLIVDGTTVYKGPLYGVETRYIGGEAFSVTYGGYLYWFPKAYYSNKGHNVVMVIYDEDNEKNK